MTKIEGALEFWDFYEESFVDTSKITSRKRIVTVSVRNLDSCQNEPIDNREDKT